MKEGAFMTVEGVEGGCNYVGQEGTIEVLQFDHQVERPMDPDDVSRVQGDRRHGVVCFVKYIDKATPILNKKLCEGSPITSIEIKWFKQPTEESGEPVHYFTHRFETCYLGSVRPSMAGGTTHGGMEHTETVEFGYQHVTWTAEVDGTEFSDDVRG
jgi:type VI secretion system secreted protein Hcp